jgi:hypothetical protein
MVYQTISKIIRPYQRLGGHCKDYQTISLKRSLSMKTTTALNHPNESAIRRGPRSGAAKTAVTDEREPAMLRKRIGSTEYLVKVRYCPTATETLEDKLLRLILAPSGAPLGDPVESEVDKSA